MRPISVLCSVVRFVAVVSVLLILFFVCNTALHLGLVEPETADLSTSATASVGLLYVSDHQKIVHHRLLETVTKPPVVSTETTNKPGPDLHTVSSANISSPHGLRNNRAPEVSQVYHKTVRNHAQKVLQANEPSISKLFDISQVFHWPQPRAVKSMKELMREKWIGDLQSSILKLPSHEVILLTSNRPYTEVLLNWMIAAVTKASVNISQVLVISMDMGLHSLLQERGIMSVLVRPQSLLTAAAVKEGSFPTVMMTRLSIIRLLNHWGYDVFNFDTDAVLLRNPFPLLQSHEDIVGTFGRFPTDLTKRWGITLCTAVLVVRSSPITEGFWETVSKTASSSFSDQGKMNYGLQALGVKWTLPSRNLGSLSHPVQGHCRNGLKVQLLPYNVACRAGSCTHKALSAGLYVWHKGGARLGEKKKEGAEEGGVWLIRSDWRVGCDMKQARKWLECISL